MIRKLSKNKKGVSVVIGYVLLVAISIIMSVLVYRWIKTYVPKDIAECPDGTSIAIKDIRYNCTSNIINMTLKNNGRFSLDGYFIRASNNTTSMDVLANIDIANNITGLSESEKNSVLWGNYIKFHDPDNYFFPNSVSRIYLFNVSDYGQISKIEIIPLRREVIDNKARLATCGSVKVQESLTCSN